ncbi:MAG: hypothetical protein WA667_01880 [Candidatus Nitrosopolaris sp.]
MPALLLVTLDDCPVEIDGLEAPLKIEPLRLIRRVPTLQYFPL